MDSNQPHITLPRRIRDHPTPHPHALICVKESVALETSLKDAFGNLLPALHSTRAPFNEENQASRRLRTKRLKHKASQASETAEVRLSTSSRVPYCAHCVEEERFANRRLEEKTMRTMAPLTRICDKKLLSPERNLVSDILLEVFRYLSEESAAMPYGPGVAILPSLVSVSQVCRRWRHVAIHHRALWKKARVICDGFPSPELAVKMLETFYTSRLRETSMGISLIISDTGEKTDDDDDQHWSVPGDDDALPRTTLEAFVRSLSAHPNICARICALSFHFCNPFERLPPSLGPSFAASLVNLEAFATSRADTRSISTGMHHRLQHFLEHLAKQVATTNRASLEEGGYETRFISTSRLKSLKLDHARFSLLEVRQILTLHRGLEDIALTVSDRTEHEEQEVYPEMTYDKTLCSLRFTFREDSECLVDDVLKAARIIIPKATRVTQIGGEDKGGFISTPIVFLGGGVEYQYWHKV